VTNRAPSCTPGRRGRRLGCRLRSSNVAAADSMASCGACGAPATRSERIHNGGRIHPIQYDRALALRDAGADGSALDRLRVSTINVIAAAADPAQPSPSIRLPRRPPRVVRDRGTL
jgi:hypothetical protein